MHLHYQTKVCGGTGEVLEVESKQQYLLIFQVTVTRVCICLAELSTSTEKPPMRYCVVLKFIKQSG